MQKLLNKLKFMFKGKLTQFRLYKTLVKMFALLLHKVNIPRNPFNAKME